MRKRFATLACMTAALHGPAVPAENAQQTIAVGSSREQVLAAKITVADMRRSYDYYTKVIGLQVVPMPGLPPAVLDDPAVDYTDVKLNYSGSRADPFLILRKQKDAVPAREQAELTWLVIKIKDVRAAVSQVKSLGLDVQVEPRELMGATIAVVHDPDGYVLELLQAPAVAASD